MFWSVKARKLTLPGSLLGGFLCFLIYIGVGYIGVIFLAAFFLLANRATSWKRSKKKHLEQEAGPRNAGQVFANSGVAGILGLIAFYFPEAASLCLLMIAAVFSSATADTLSSELGNVYGKRFYNILSLKKDEKGLNGVVSIEGSAFGMLGSMCIALIYSLHSGLNLNFLFIVLAGTLGNLSDSIMGASLERKGLLNNNMVNFLNTALGAAAMWLFVG